MARSIQTFDNGVEVFQVSDTERLVSNIYCEQPYCSRDGSRFLYARQMNGAGPKDISDFEFVLCTFGTWEEEVVGRGQRSGSVSYDGGYYYARPAAGKAVEFVRIDLATGASETVFAWPDGINSVGHPTVSPDGRLVAYHRNLSWEPQMFAVEAADLKRGTTRILWEDPFVRNAHAQFHPSDNRTILVQHNRGTRISPEGKQSTTLREEKVTLVLLDAETGAVERLAVGDPETPRCSGHQAWIPGTDDVILTTSRVTDHPDNDKYRTADEGGHGNILVVRRGEPARPICPDWPMLHIGTTPCGRFYAADGSRDGIYNFVLGSTRTRKCAHVYHHPVHDAAAEMGQLGHAHVYLSPDYRWIVFNSCRTGRPEVYAARIPEKIIADLES